MFLEDFDKVEPLTPKAKELARAIRHLIECESDLEEAKRTVPDYTGQWKPEDYYGQEHSDRNKAANKLARIIHGR